MATSTSQITDVAGALAGLLRTVPDLRVYEMVMDTARPPCVVIGQPTLDFADPDAGWCFCTWSFPLNLLSIRNSAVEAQRELSQMLLDVSTALKADVPGIFSIEPQTARPITVVVSGSELPGYQLDVRVRA